MSALGLVTATLGFTVLTGTSQTTTAVLNGTIGHAWASPYDLLVRPANSTTPLEAKDGLVRPNFLRGLVGGISMADLQKIRATPGVQVAAPIAVLGFLAAGTGPTVDLTQSLTSGLNVFRLSGIITADAGQSTYAYTEYFVIDSGGGVLDAGQSPAVLHEGSRTVTCSQKDPQIGCEAVKVCSPSTRTPDHCGVSPVSGNWTRGWPELIGIAGIDPVAENRLVGLNRCVTSGRPLTASTTLPIETVGPSEPVAHIPLVAATTAFIDESIHIDVAKAGDPNAILTNGTLPRTWLPIQSVTQDPNSLYESWLHLVSQGRFGSGAIGNILVPGAVAYTQASPTQLMQTSSAPDLSVLTAGNGSDLPSDKLSPLDARDTAVLPEPDNRWV